MQGSTIKQGVTRLLLICCLLFVGASAQADSLTDVLHQTRPGNVAYHPPGSVTANANPMDKAVQNLAQSGEFVFSSPPRGSAAEETAYFQPIAEYLTRVTGKKFVYKYSDNWLAYQSNMQKDRYDLVFDGPHFVSWRIAHREHEPLVKIPGDFIFVFLVRKDNTSIQKLSDLAGRSVCGHAPPNQGTLHLYNMFTNPARQPQLVDIQGWRPIYKAMLAGKCVGSVVPVKIYNELDPTGKDTKVLHITKAAPGQAFTASKRIPADIRAKIAEALMSDQGQTVTAKLREYYPSKPYVRANKPEYADEEGLLKDSYGFGS